MRRCATGVARSQQRRKAPSPSLSPEALGEEELERGRAGLRPPLELTRKIMALPGAHLFVHPWRRGIAVVSRPARIPATRAANHDALQENVDPWEPRSAGRGAPGPASPGDCRGRCGNAALPAARARRARGAGTSGGGSAQAARPDRARALLRRLAQGAGARHRSRDAAPRDRRAGGEGRCRRGPRPDVAVHGARRFRARPQRRQQRRDRRRLRLRLPRSRPAGGEGEAGPAGAGRSRLRRARRQRLWPIRRADREPRSGAGRQGPRPAEGALRRAVADARREAAGEPTRGDRLEPWRATLRQRGQVQRPGDHHSPRAAGDRGPPRRRRRLHRTV